MRSLEKARPVRWPDAGFVEGRRARVRGDGGRWRYDDPVDRRIRPRRTRRSPLLVLDLPPARPRLPRNAPRNRGPGDALEAVAANDRCGSDQLLQERERGLAAHSEWTEDRALREPWDGTQGEPDLSRSVATALETTPGLSRRGCLKDEALNPTGSSSTPTGRSSRPGGAKGGAGFCPGRGHPVSFTHLTRRTRGCGERPRAARP